MTKIKVGSDFSGVGAFDQALIRLGIDYETLFACDMDKYARQTFVLNYGEPNYFPKDVYEREIPKERLDIYMTSPPCQAFSLAGKRKGEEDKRGVLFYNSHEFIQKNNPRYFIFENVKGLLSDDNGKTFQRWIDFLGGKSVNGNPVIFPHEESVPYHVYYQVLNAKSYNIPQNRERIFIIGIRDDEDNHFSFPKPMHLTKRLKDVLESEVDEKYFLSKDLIDFFITNTNTNKEKGNGFAFKPKKEEEIGNSITTKSGSRMDDNFIKIGAIRGCENAEQKTEQTLEINQTGTSNAITTVQKDNVVVMPYQIGQSDKTFASQNNTLIGKENQEAFCIRASQPNGVVIQTNNSKGFDILTEEDTLNYSNSNSNSKTRRGRVGKGVAQTLDTNCQQGVIVSDKMEYDFVADYRADEGLRIREDDARTCITSSIRHSDEWQPKAGTRNPPLVGFKSLNEKQKEKFDSLEVDENVSGCITEAIGRAGSSDEYISSVKRNAIITQRIRRLTPLECFRLMDFNENFVWDVSDSQAYKQAGNSICVGVLAEIIKKLKL